MLDTAERIAILCLDEWANGSSHNHADEHACGLAELASGDHDMVKFSKVQQKNGLHLQYTEQLADAV